MKLDRFDIAILKCLQTDGRMPTARLAEHIGLSSSPTWARVRRLEEAGIIRGYHADLSVECLNRLLHFVVTLNLESHRAQDRRRFEQAVVAVPEVVECWAVGGEIDYLLRFVVPDVTTYQEAIERVLSADLGIERYWTYIVTKAVKPFGGVPLERLTAQPSDSAEQRRRAPSRPTFERAEESSERGRRPGKNKNHAPAF